MRSRTLARVDAVRAAYRTLSERSRYVLTARLGLGGPARHLNEIGPELNVHQSTVHLAERKAMAALQAACSAPGELTDREWVASCDA